MAELKVVMVAPLVFFKVVKTTNSVTFGGVKIFTMNWTVIVYYTRTYYTLYCILISVY